MSDPRPDTPTVQVEFETPWGKGTQQVNVQGNRHAPRERFTYTWLAVLFPPTNPADLALDAACYILTAALTASIASRFLWVLVLPPVLFLLLAVCSGLAVLCYTIAQEVKRAWILLLYRAFLLAVGVIVGGIL